MSSEPNLRVLRQSRKKLSPGDVFALSPRDGLYLFGRVIATDAAVGPFQRLNLIYVYDVTSDRSDPPIERLTPPRLLVPPMMINRLPWSRGYFENVAHVELGAGDLLPQHCFRDSRGRYFDEYGNELHDPVEPIGTWGVHSFRTVDDAVSAALSIPLAE